MKYLVLLWGLWFCSEGFGFVVRYFVFAVRFSVLPWGILFLPWGFWFCREVFCFCREVFGFAVTVVGHHPAAPHFISTLRNNGATCRSLRCNLSPFHRFVVTVGELYEGWLCSTNSALRSSNFYSIRGLLPELLYMVSVLHVAVVSLNLDMM